ncbi:hypothetical protein [Streptomyces sp. NPDC053079]|uniref:hypothetical protein n=1 Tax=Streptomyces sp. NPDC053079 TaxID=3365697 RepID=UPI0037CF259E
MAENVTSARYGVVGGCFDLPVGGQEHPLRFDAEQHAAILALTELGNDESNAVSSAKAAP